ncbi:LysR family transcriptional regulator [Roseococcus sp. SDR]|uniref:LysR family transcriptional regulator n=1 Tax=Roseococcus sp. SDR TaxID=2835532 RepID=UPI001BCE23A9|nr:LysR family transcriptional regulator [Roseococcus sp. SDR]MBS7789052.1 LysR family transcriptional regulator [Roseococcus sp. SDR]MBV1844366.1 LysR family transcriptional regulator [Roseococcus sp. SDR]
MDRFAAISAFIAVVDRHGFAPAARHLGLVPSAVTRHVAALEAHLGVQLLARTTRSVTLTEAGAHYLERARRIMAELAEAEEFAASERLTPVGRLVVSAPAVFGRLHVAPLLAEFLARHDAVQADLRLSDRWVNMVEEGVDCAIRIGHLPDSGLVARRLGETRRIIVAAPGYLARHGTPREPRDLAPHRIIRFSAFEGAEEWRLYRDGVEERVPIAPRLVTNSADAALCAAERGGGLTMVLAYQAREAIAAGRLTRVLGTFEPLPLPIQLAWPAARLVPAKLRAFIALATESCDWRFA